MWDLAEPQGAEQGSPNAKCSATPATDTEHNSRAERNWGMQAERQRQEKPESRNSVRALNSPSQQGTHLTVNGHKFSIGVWSSLQIHCQEHDDEGCIKTVTQKESPITPYLPYLTQGGCKRVSSQIVMFIMQQAEQAKQFTWESVPRDFTTISFQPGTQQSLTHLPVGLQTCAWRTLLHPPRD